MIIGNVGGKSKERKAKSYNSGSMWRTIVGDNDRAPIDAFGHFPPPTDLDLVRAFEDTVYACASLIAQTVQATPLRLYVNTEAGQAKAKCPTRKLTRKAFCNLQTKTHLGRRITKSVDVEEVADHPILDCLYHANEFHTISDLLELVDLFLEVTGDAYLHMETDGYIPTGLWLLPSQYVQVVKDPQTQLPVLYKHGYGNQWVEYTPDEIIHIRFASLLDPYADGMSPLRAVWERVMIGKKSLAFSANILDTAGRPDAILSPRDINAPLGLDEGKRLVREFTQQWRHNPGGLTYFDSPVEIQPLNWSPTDTSPQQLSDTIRNAICAAYKVPTVMLSPQDGNRAAALASKAWLAENAVLPRLRKIEEALNAKLCPLFDDRLFLAFDSPVPEDEETTRAWFVAADLAGAVTRQEWRDRLGLDEEEWAEEPLIPAGRLPLDALAVQAASVDSNLALDEPAPTPEPVTPEPTQTVQEPPVRTPDEAAAQGDVAATALNGAQVSSLMEIISAVASGQLPPETAKHVIGAAFPLIDQRAIDGMIGSLSGFQPRPEPGAAPAAPEPTLPEAPPPQAKSLKAMTKRLAPDHVPLEKALQKFFLRQEKAVLARLPSIKTIRKKASNLIKPGEWDKELDGDVRAVMEMYWDEGSKSLVTDLGLSPDVLKVVNPKIKESLDAWTFKFAQSTNETTAMKINEAHAKLKEELSQGIIDGESFTDKLTERVKEVYHSASTERAFAIAKTESTRAINKSQQVTAEAAEDEGIELRKVWHLSNNPCDLCAAVAATHKAGIPVREKFFEDEYDDGLSGSRHTNCECYITYELANS